MLCEILEEPHLVNMIEGRLARADAVKEIPPGVVMFLTQGKHHSAHRTRHTALKRPPDGCQRKAMVLFRGEYAEAGEGVH